MGATSVGLFLERQARMRFFSLRNRVSKKGEKYGTKLENIYVTKSSQELM